MAFDGIHRKARISSCGQYRYTLTRRWGPGLLLVFVMLNPSTADAETDDPTIRRCMSFARREDFDGILVVNLFAGRATKPADLFAMADPFGPENADTLAQTLMLPGVKVAAWGAAKQAEPFAAELAASFEGLWCLGTTKTGAPRHPLYVRADQPLLSWPIQEAA